MPGKCTCTAFGPRPSPSLGDPRQGLYHLAIPLALPLTYLQSLFLTDGLAKLLRLTLNLRYHPASASLENGVIDLCHQSWHTVHFDGGLPYTLPSILLPILQCAAAIPPWRAVPRGFLPECPWALHAAVSHSCQSL